MPSFPVGTMELVVLHPFTKRTFEWTDLPICVKENAEMNFHGPAYDDLYGTYGVNPETGAAVVVRPDGYVGMISSLLNVFEVENYLNRCLVRI
jgi:phenol 2-monooxygenase